MYENESYILKAACHKCYSPRKNDRKKVINACEKVEKWYRYSSCWTRNNLFMAWLCNLLNTYMKTASILHCYCHFFFYKGDNNYVLYITLLNLKEKVQQNVCILLKWKHFVVFWTTYFQNPMNFWFRTDLGKHLIHTQT